LKFWDFSFEIPRFFSFGDSEIFHLLRIWVFFCKILSFFF
jgi:hypothetical protein